MKRAINFLKNTFKKNSTPLQNQFRQKQTGFLSPWEREMNSPVPHKIVFRTKQDFLQAISFSTNNFSLVNNLLENE